MKPDHCAYGAVKETSDSPALAVLFQWLFELRIPANNSISFRTLTRGDSESVFYVSVVFRR
jgi:hypothetical protein